MRVRADPRQDLRNHGASPHARPHTYAALAADVHRFIAQHRIKDPTLIGHSMGAKAAMTLALQRPGLVANLVAVDNAPVDAALKTDFHGYVAGMLEVQRRGVRRRGDADEVLRPWAKVRRRAFLFSGR
jgi:pimeloyl-ACP methyl ester carboxylesterase